MSIHGAGLAGPIDDGDLADKDVDALALEPPTAAVLPPCESAVPVEVGWRAWLDVLGTMLVNAMCCMWALFGPGLALSRDVSTLLTPDGMTGTFGVFQQYYEENTLATSTATQISWIGALQFCLCPLLGCVSGPLFDAGHLRPLLLCGGALYVGCMMLASLAERYYQVLLAHGLGVGLGMGLVFSSSVATLAQHFAGSRWLPLAYGLQATGSAIAGVVMPITLRYLLPSVGYAWTMRIVGFIALLCIGSAYFCLSATLPPRKTASVLNPRVFRSVPYSLYVLGGGLLSLSIYAPLTFSVTFAASHGISVGLANYAPAIMNAVSIIGRLLPLFFARRLGSVNILIGASVWAGVMLLVWTRATTTGGVFAFDAMYSIASGAFGSSYNPAAASFAPNPDQAGLYLGMCFFVNAFFWLAGTPIMAALTDGPRGYLPGSIFGGAVVLSGAAVVTFAMALKRRTLRRQVESGQDAGR